MNEFRVTYTLNDESQVGCAIEHGTSLWHRLVQIFTLFAILSVLTSCSKNTPTESENLPPSKPKIDIDLGTPVDSAIDISTSPSLCWTCDDPSGDVLSYDVYFGDYKIPTPVSSEQTTQCYTPETLEYSTTYYWRVIAKDEHGSTTSSDTWQFTTTNKPPLLSLSQSILGFGTVHIGESLETSFTITNIGGGQLTGHVTAECGQFSITDGIGDYNLGAGRSHTVRVSFLPATEEESVCIIQTGELNSTVTCSGTGGPRRINCTVSPSEIVFPTIGTNRFLEQELTITNSGGLPFSGSIEEACEVFSVSAGSLSYTLDPGESHAVMIRFTPDIVGQFSCPLDIGASCPPLTLSGTGRNPTKYRCGFSQDKTDFGEVTIGSQGVLYFGVGNGSDYPLRIEASTDDYRFSITENNWFDAWLEPGESRLFPITFTPTAPRAESTILTIRGCYLDYEMEFFGTGVLP